MWNGACSSQGFGLGFPTYWYHRNLRSSMRSEDQSVSTCGGTWFCETVSEPPPESQASVPGN